MWRVAQLKRSQKWLCLRVTGKTPRKDIKVQINFKNIPRWSVLDKEFWASYLPRITQAVKVRRGCCCCGSSRLHDVYRSSSIQSLASSMWCYSGKNAECTSFGVMETSTEIWKESLRERHCMAQSEFLQPSPHRPINIAMKVRPNCNEDLRKMEIPERWNLLEEAAGNTQSHLRPWPRWNSHKGCTGRVARSGHSVPWVLVIGV